MRGPLTRGHLKNPYDSTALPLLRPLDIEI